MLACALFVGVDDTVANYWRALYIVTIALVVGFRVLVPIAGAFRYPLRIGQVVVKGPGVVSPRLSGTRLDSLHAEAGQFFLFCFLGPGH